MLPAGSWDAPAIESANPELHYGYFPMPGSDNPADNKYLARQVRRGLGGGGADGEQGRGHEVAGHVLPARELPGLRECHGHHAHAAHREAQHHAGQGSGAVPGQFPPRLRASLGQPEGVWSVGAAQRVVLQALQPVGPFLSSVAIPFTLSIRKKFAFPFLFSSSKCTACKPSCRSFTT